MQADYLIMRNVEAVVSVLSQFSERLINMQSLIVLEHAAVSAADLSSLDRITQDKVVAGDSIESTVRHLKKSSQELATSIDEESEGFAGSLSEISLLFDQLCAARPTSDFESQRSKVLDLIEECLAIHRELNPKIKTNKKMLEKMLQFQQESQNFWSDVLQETEATYGADGSRKKDGPASSAIKISI